MLTFHTFIGTINNQPYLWFIDHEGVATNIIQISASIFPDVDGAVLHGYVTPSLAIDLNAFKRLLQNF